MASAQRVDVEEGICLFALEELHGRDLACGNWWSDSGDCTASITSAACVVAAYIPLMILQKMHAAAMLGGGFGGMRDGCVLLDWWYSPRSLLLYDSSVECLFPRNRLSLASISCTRQTQPHFPCSSTSAQCESNPSLSPNRLSALIKHTATTACATILAPIHPNRRHASRPDRVCTPAVMLHAMHKTLWLHHATVPQIGQN